MKIGKKELSELYEKACNSNDGFSRICLHNIGSEKVQLMIIAASPGTIYPPISDNMKGWITYTVLSGSLTIRTYKQQNKELTNVQNTYSLEFGETIKIDRNIFRETICDKERGAIYMEVIEGSFDKSKRSYLN